MIGIVTTLTSDQIAAMQEQAQAIANAFTLKSGVKKPHSISEEFPFGLRRVF